MAVLPLVVDEVEVWQGYGAGEWPVLLTMTTPHRPSNIVATDAVSIPG